MNPIIKPSKRLTFSVKAYRFSIRIVSRDVTHSLVYVRPSVDLLSNAMLKTQDAAKRSQIKHYRRSEKPHANDETIEELAKEFIAFDLSKPKAVLSHSSLILKGSKETHANIPSLINHCRELNLELAIHPDLGHLAPMEDPQ